MIHRDIRLAITVRKSSYLVSEPNSHTIKRLSERFFAKETNYVDEKAKGTKRCIIKRELQLKIAKTV